VGVTSLGRVGQEGAYSYGQYVREWLVQTKYRFRASPLSIVCPPSTFGSCTVHDRGS